MSRDLTAGIELAYAERSDFLIIALTGRTGSGCTTTADILTKSFDDIPISLENMAEIESRKLKIAQDYARSRWIAFQRITVSTVIFGYLLEQQWGSIESFLASHKAKDSQLKAISKILDGLREDNDYESYIAVTSQGLKTNRADAWIFFSNKLLPAAKSVKSILGNIYAPIFQALGDNIRYSGNALDNKIKTQELFSLVRRVKRLAKAAFYADQQSGKSSTRIVIDAIRNPLELVYLRDQFSAFYAIAITTKDADRKQRLLNGSVSHKDIDAIDRKEYAKKSLTSYENFVSQNIKDCIQKSDIFFANPGETTEFDESIRQLRAQVVRYVSLMLRPGLLTPTKEERCMQLAFVSKLNSGCISRQVGAAVTDRSHSIKAVGWNDVPKGQVPCLLRDVGALLGPGDADAFSDYEKTDKRLRDHLGKKFDRRQTLKTSSGLSCPFCFKDAFNEINDNDNNQVHTRSLHAEENAFLQLAKYGNSGIEGGILYTTASPCELCSKKAFQLGIKTIIYVDPYPGISSSHVLASGTGRPDLKLFSGAVGHAYHRLYESILPIKDEYMARLSDDPQPNLL